MGTIGDELARVVGAQRPCDCPSWPPDVYAAVASVLQATSGLLRIADLPAGIARLPDEVVTPGRAWRASLSRPGSDLAKLPHPPDACKDAWDRLQKAGVAFANLADEHDAAVMEAITDLVFLLGAADEASVGIGLSDEAPPPDPKQPNRDRSPRIHRSWWNAALAQNANRSLCFRVPLHLARVLPKQHTSQRGFTLRNLTHHLAFLPFLDVDALWNSPVPLAEKAAKKLEPLHVLALPWPLHLDRRAFRPLKRSGEKVELNHGHTAYFELDRKPSPEEAPERLASLQKYLLGALEQAKRLAPDLDILVFPELALTPNEFEAVLAIADEERALVIAGVSVAAGETFQGVEGPANISVFALPPRMLDDKGHARPLVFTQRKHHRWCLDERQVLQYGLQGFLPLKVDLWERVHIAPRQANFFTVKNWLTVTTLLCEDLARQDPMAPTLRAIGPNLVFALLMDGPQTRERWGSQYAASLAEDPGCSVLTLTSMALPKMMTARGTGKPDRSGVVGLWRDYRGQAVEIDLAPGEDAALLHLHRVAVQEFSADGRGDGGTAFFPVLKGYQGLRSGLRQRSVRRAPPKGSIAGEPT